MRIVSRIPQEPIPTNAMRNGSMSHGGCGQESWSVSLEENKEKISTFLDVNCSLNVEKLNLRFSLRFSDKIYWKFHTLSLTLNGINFSVQDTKQQSQHWVNVWTGWSWRSKLSIVKAQNELLAEFNSTATVTISQISTVVKWFKSLFEHSWSAEEGKETNLWVIEWFRTI